MNKAVYDFITWADTTSSNPQEVEALSYDSCNLSQAIPANSFVIIRDEIQKRAWLGQTIQPNCSIPKGLKRDNPNAISASERVLRGEAEETVFLEQFYYYRIKLIGDITNGQMESVRIRPRIGAKGRMAEESEVLEYISLPEKTGDKELNNILGIIKDSSIPVCLDSKRIYYHTLLAGATGGGKSNTIGNMIKAAQALGMAVIVFDHKPDYQDIDKANTETHLFSSFEQLKLEPKALEKVKYFRLYSDEDDFVKNSEIAISIRAGDASNGMLSTALFYRSGEELQREAFFNMLGHFTEDLKTKGRDSHNWTIKDFETWVNSHRKTKKVGGDNKTDWSMLAEYFNGESPNELVIKGMLNRLATRKPVWMDAGSTYQPRKTGIFAENQSYSNDSVEYFDPINYLKAQEILVIRRPHTSGGREYGLFLSYLLDRVLDLRRLNKIDCPVMLVIDEAHEIFAGDSLLRNASERVINRALFMGRSKKLGFVIALQSPSQVPSAVMQNLNTRIIHRQNSEDEIKCGVSGVPKEMLNQAVNFGPGEALVKMFGVNAPIHAQMAPSPFELTKDLSD